MSHACVHLNYKRNLLKKADGLRKRKHGLISPLTWPIFDGKAVFNERNIQIDKQLLKKIIQAIMAGTYEENEELKFEIYSVIN